LSGSARERKTLRFTEDIAEAVDLKKTPIVSLFFSPASPTNRKD